MNLSVTHIFKQEGELKAIDEQVYEILQKTWKYQHEIKSMQEQMSEGLGLEK